MKVAELFETNINPFFRPGLSHQEWRLAHRSCRATVPPNICATVLNIVSNAKKN